MKLHKRTLSLCLQQKEREKEIKKRRKERNAAKAAGEFDDLVSALKSGDIYGTERKNKSTARPAVIRRPGNSPVRIGSSRERRNQAV